MCDSSNMNRYKVTYRQSRDSETQTCTVRAYDAEHAEDKFFDSMDEEGGIEGLIVDAVTLIKPSKQIRPIFR